jgi:hypothetical protein
MQFYLFAETCMITKVKSPKQKSITADKSTIAPLVVNDISLVQYSQQVTIVMIPAKIDVKARK